MADYKTLTPITSAAGISADDLVFGADGPQVSGSPVPFEMQAIANWVVAYDAELAAIAGLASAADRLPYFTGSGTASLATFTSAGRALVDDADASAQRTTLWAGFGNWSVVYTNGSSVPTALAVGALGTILAGQGVSAAPTFTSAPEITTIELGHATDTTLARSSAGNVSIEGNIIYRAGGTDVPVADGGTGASTAAAARTNLGVHSIYCEAYKSSNQSLTIDTLTKIVFEVEASDASSILASNTVTIPSGGDGTWAITFVVSSDDGSQMAPVIKVNSTYITGAQSLYSSNITVAIPLVANDTVEFYVYPVENLIINGTSETHIWVARVGA